MGRYFAVFLLIIYTVGAFGQASFKVLFKTYPTGSVKRTYNYDYNFKDNSIMLWLTDSVITYTSKDSTIIMTEVYPVREKITRTVDYLNTKKQIVKTEHFILDYLYKTTEWKYDTLGHITLHSEKEKDSKTRSYTRAYVIETKKTIEGCTETERCNFNGKLEYTTINYYDRSNKILRQVRENDAHKPIHIETYNYSTAGKLLSREVFFPEFGITKYYKETQWNTKCNKVIPYTGDLITEEYMELVLKKEMMRYKAILQDPDCQDMEYILTNFANTITFKRQAEHNKRTASISIKHKMK